MSVHLNEVNQLVKMKENNILHTVESAWGLEKHHNNGIKFKGELIKKRANQSKVVHMIHSL